MEPTVELHPLVGRPGTLRIWVGAFDAPVVDDVSWVVDGVVAEPDHVVRVRPEPAASPADLTDGVLAQIDSTGSVNVQTGVFDLEVGGPRVEHRIHVVVRLRGRPPLTTTDLTTRALPDRVPTELGSSFNVLLVSCFFGRNDGGAGALVDHRLRGPYQPDLVLTVGDQVYLDNPPLQALHLTETEFPTSFERQYRENWTGLGYARILRAAPVAAIPDDHEYWNNYPQAGTLWPATWFEGTRRTAWVQNARAMFDGFQLAQPDTYCSSFDVRPLSFFMMDNRTFRDRASFGHRVPSLRDADRQLFSDWVDRVLRDPELMPVLSTGPSLLQPAAGLFKRHFFDRNFANYADYGFVMENILRMSTAGRTPLLLTGDVHYPRVTKAHHMPGRGPRIWTQLFEVISSPASLVAKPYGESQHAAERFALDDLGTWLQCEHVWPTDDRPDARGDHVALLRFRATATGVTVEPTYWMINGSAAPRNPLTAPTLTLQRFPADV